MYDPEVQKEIDTGTQGLEDTFNSFPPNVKIAVEWLIYLIKAVVKGELSNLKK